MLAAMTSKQVSEWQVFLRLENEGTPEEQEDAQITELGLSEQASKKLKENLAKRRAG